MSDPKKEKKALVRRDAPSHGAKNKTSAHSGVTITGGRSVGESKTEVLPTDRQNTMKYERKYLKNVAWNHFFTLVPNFLKICTLLCV